MRKLGKSMFNNLFKKRRRSSVDLKDTSYGVNYYQELENEFADDMYSNYYEGLHGSDSLGRNYNNYQSTDTSTNPGNRELNQNDNSTNQNNLNS